MYIKFTAFSTVASFSTKTTSNTSFYRHSQRFFRFSRLSSFNSTSWLSCTLTFSSQFSFFSFIFSFSQRKAFLSCFYDFNSSENGFVGGRVVGKFYDERGEHINFDNISVYIYLLCIFETWRVNFKLHLNSQTRKNKWIFPEMLREGSERTIL